MTTEVKKDPVGVANGGRSRRYINDHTHDYERYQEEFLRAMAERGIQCHTEVVADGKIHRFGSLGRSDKACWYVWYGNAGAFGDWRSGVRARWSTSMRTLSATDRVLPYKEIETARQLGQHDLEARQREAAIQAQGVWEALAEDGESPYLTRKQIKGLGVRYDHETVVVPLRTVDGEIRSVQYIYADGTKRFLKGGRTHGCYHLLGEMPIETLQGIPLYVAEGYATGASIHMAMEAPVIVCFSANNILPVVDSLRQRYPKQEIIVCGDEDRWRPGGNIGREGAEQVAARHQTAVVFPSFEHGDGQPTDFNDLHVLEGLEAVRHQLTTGIQAYWTAPTPLHTELRAVLPLTEAMLPEAIRAWVMDIGERMQCPLDFVAIPALVMFGSLIGARCAIRPKRHDDWSVVANIWGCIVGHPGALKSPAMAEVLRPLKLMELGTHAAYQKDLEAFHKANEVYEIQKRTVIARYKQAAQQGKGGDDLSTLLASLTPPTRPKRERYMTNDVTVEKLCEILADNPRGVLLVRDELYGVFSQWHKKGHECDRTFYLEAWNGKGSYTADRIGRGTTYVPTVCVSMIGSTQPDKLKSLVWETVQGTYNDGLMQRFQLFVYPDIKAIWQLIDRPRDEGAQRAVAQLCYRIADLNFESWADATGGETLPYVQFSEGAQGVFNAWLTRLETEQLRSTTHPSYIQEHLAKYRKLLPALALIFHVIECVSHGEMQREISQETVHMAIAWCEYLESHAHRIYGLGMNHPMAAQRLLEHILKKELKDGFGVRDIYRKGWKQLSDRREVESALNELVAHGYVKDVVVPSAFQHKGTVTYLINPKSWGREENG